MHNFFFGIYPYIALAVLAIGSIARYERDPFTWKSKSSQLLRRKQLIMGSVLFHLGVLTIFAGPVTRFTEATANQLLERTPYISTVLESP
jgi:respiratory nitrate reductase gamma subunit